MHSSIMTALGQNRRINFSNGSLENANSLGRSWERNSIESDDSGLFREVLETLPISVYAEDKTGSSWAKPSLSDDATCMICLGHYIEGERLRWLPCVHAFHRECIDTWLKSSVKCPLCKLNIMRDQQKERIYQQEEEITIIPSVWPPCSRETPSSDSVRRVISHTSDFLKGYNERSRRIALVTPALIGERSRQHERSNREPNAIVSRMGKAPNRQYTFPIIRRLVIQADKNVKRTNIRQKYSCLLYPCC